MEYPKYVKVDDKKYKINTSYKVAIQCDKIARDKTIGDYERALAIIYKLFGSEALGDKKNLNRLLELAKKYLSCGKELKDNGKKPDMSFEQDMDFIETSFMSDFGIDLETTDMHWWKFMNHMNGLSNSELGNCCILNKIRNIRNYDTSKIKDVKFKKEIEEQQKIFALKDDEVKKELTETQLNNINEFMNSLRKE